MTTTPDAQARPRLYLHIGLPKSGSTYLQGMLATHRSVLSEAGFVYPFVRQEGMFHAALEMAGTPETWGIDPTTVAGTFDHLLRRGLALGGTVIISHEIFTAASPVQIRAIAERLTEFDVHLVITTRDISKTLTAQWQERVKNGFAESFAEYSDDLLATLPEPLEDADPTLVGFWRSQNLAWILRRWRPVAPPRRTHVVVTPARGAGPEVLWQRFASAVGIPAGLLDGREPPRGNESLSVAQIAFLRRVLSALDGRLDDGWFHVVAKRFFAQSVLAEGRGPKPVTPLAVAERLRPVTQGWIDVVERQNYRLHGDLAELLPVIAPGSGGDPDHATVEEMFDGLPAAVASMLVHERNQRVEMTDLQREHRLLLDENAELAVQVSQLATSNANLRAWGNRSTMRRVRDRVRRG